MSFVDFEHCYLIVMLMGCCFVCANRHMVRLCNRVHCYCRDQYLYYATLAYKLCHVSVHCYCKKYVVCLVSY
jgi:hypothetical protein